MTHTLRPILFIMTLSFLLFACKKENEKPDEDSNNSQIDSVVIELNYGNSCNQFERTLEGAALNSFEATSDGGFIFCGKTMSLIGNEHIYILKTNCFGEKERENIIKKETNSEGAYIKEISTGNYILLSRTKISSNSNNYYLSVMKLNANLENVSDKKYSDDTNIDYRSIKQIENSENIVALVSDYNSSSLTETMLKIDNTGSITLEKNVPALGPLHYLTPGNGTDFYATGSYNDNPVLTKLNAQGDSIWTKVYDIVGKASGFHLMFADNGDIILTGATSDISLDFDRALFCFRLTGTGDVIWSKILNSDGYINFKDISMSNDGNLIMNVQKIVGQDQIEIALVKIDLTNGSVIWDRNAGSLFANDIYGTSDNGILYIGSDVGSRTSVIRKTDPSGY